MDKVIFLSQVRTQKRREANLLKLHQSYVLQKSTPESILPTLTLHRLADTRKDLHEKAEW